MRPCSCRYSIVRCRSSLRERSTAATFVVVGASWSVLSAHGGPCISFSRVIAHEGHGRCANMIERCAKHYGGWPVGSMSGFTILPMSVRTCTSCFVRGGARHFKGFCDPSRASWPGGSREREEPDRAGLSSTAWPGREWSAGAGTTGACSTTSFATKSRATRVRVFGMRSSTARAGELCRDLLRIDSFRLGWLLLKERFVAAHPSAHVPGQLQVRVSSP